MISFEVMVAVVRIINVPINRKELLYTTRVTANKVPTCMSCMQPCSL